MTKEAPKLVTVKEAMVILGLKYTAQVHGLFKKSGGVGKIKDGHRTFVDIEALKEWREQNVNVRRPRGTKKNGAGTSVVPRFATYKSDPKLVLWNKGGQNGWAVGLVKKVSPQQVSIITDYATDAFDDINTSYEALVKDVAQMKVVFLQPNLVLRLLEVQMTALAFTDPEKSDEAEQLATDLAELASRFAALEQVWLKDNAPEEVVEEVCAQCFALVDPDGLPEGFDGSYCNICSGVVEVVLQTVRR